MLFFCCVVVEIIVLVLHLPHGLLQEEETTMVPQGDSVMTSSPIDLDEDNDVPNKMNPKNLTVPKSMEILRIFVPPGIGNAVHLMWGRERGRIDPNVTYAVYYEKDDQELIVPKLTTTNLTASVEGLDFCSMYRFGVGVAGVDRIDPNVVRVVGTFLDPEKVPEGLRVDFEPGAFPCLVVRWRASCANVGRPVGYIVSVFEKTTSTNKILTVPATKDADLVYNLKVNYDEDFDVKVSTNYPGSKATEKVSCRIPGFLQPYKVRVTSNQEDGAFMVYWSEPYVPEYVGRVYYEVYIYKGLNVTTVGFEKYYVTRPVLIYKGDDTLYTFSVGSVSYEGQYRSALTRPIAADLYGGVQELDD